MSAKPHKPKGLCRIFQHWWRTNRVNPFMLPTHQTCRICGVTRSVNTKDTASGVLEYLWDYSDGTRTGPHNFGEGF